MENMCDYNELLNELKTISEHYSEDNTSSDWAELKNFKDNFNMKILFIGHFSAGKSALINGLIGKRILIEAQLPQTSIAAEVKYTDSDEHCIAKANDGTITEFKPGTEFDANNYINTEYYVNSEALKLLNDYVIVDTPGFDSGIENHNKALSNYLPKGVAFILIIDVEKGTIDKDSINFLREVSHYSSNIAVILNKCDKKTAENVSKIKESVENSLEVYGFSQIPVFCLSAYENDISQKLSEVIKTFNAEDIFKQRINKEIYNCSSKMLSKIKIIKNTSELDTYDIDNKIRELQREKEKLDNKFKSLSDENNSESINDKAEEIIDEVKEVLTNHCSEIAEALINGSDKAAQAVIIQSIRPVINENMKNISVNYLNEAVENINMNIKLDDDTMGNIKDIIFHITDSLKNNISEGTFQDVTGEIHNENKPKERKSSNGIDTYKMITGITAITTEIVAPWVEILIICAPDIINLVSGLMSNPIMKNKAKKQVINNVIPQVCNNLFPNIEKAIRNNVQAVNSELEKIYKSQFDEINNSLQKTKSEKDKTEAEYNKKMSEIKSDMEKLEKIIEMTGENYGN